MNSNRNQAISIGRNDPCLCGSGKKYKKCCLDAPHSIVESEERLVQSMRKKMSTDFPGKEMMLGTSEELGIVKMSEVILEFAEDMLRQSDTREEEKRAMEVAIIAWNISLMDKETQEKAINDFAKKENKKNKGVAKELLKLLINRKNELYSDIERLIVNYEILNTRDGGLHLNVASLVKPQLD